MKTPRTLLNHLRSYATYKAKAMAIQRPNNYRACGYHRSAETLCNYFINCPDVKYLGSGSFSVVVQCEGRVFKIVRNVDHAYDHFYQFCKAIGPNRYLPEFKGRWIIRGFTVYELEKLNHFLSVDHRETIGCLPYNYRHKQFVCEELQSLVNLMDEWLKENDSGLLMWDLHNGNFATRDKMQLVIIDPWA